MGVGLLAKVCLGDVLKPRQGLSPSERTGADNRICRKHVDFLLVRVSNLVPLAGIELDDSSHARAARQKRDAFVADVFRPCCLPLLNVPAQASYSVAVLQACLAVALCAAPESGDTQLRTTRLAVTRAARPA